MTDSPLPPAVSARSSTAPLAPKIASTSATVPPADASAAWAATRAAICASVDVPPNGSGAPGAPLLPSPLASACLEDVASAESPVLFTSTGMPSTGAPAATPPEAAASSAATWDTTPDTDTWPHATTPSTLPDCCTKSLHCFLNHSSASQFLTDSESSPRASFSCLCNSTRQRSRSACIAASAASSSRCCARRASCASRSRCSRFSSSSCRCASAMRRDICSRSRRAMPRLRYQRTVRAQSPRGRRHGVPAASVGADGNATGATVHPTADVPTSNNPNR